MIYRREIDGLRAVAVLPVILFHAGFKWVSGGYIGVDIFFVISGYLITSIIVGEQEAGKFTILRFYERRARRILPALFIVLLACLPFAWMWMLPDQLSAFARSIVAVTFFASNILFWQETDYFESAAEAKPLLHTWSLAVEEQYYVIFPVFMIVCWALGKRKLVGIIALVGIVSLGLAEWASKHASTANFYLIPTRAWELMIGALAAFYLRGDAPTESRLNQLGAAAGLGLIVLALFGLDSTTPFPGFYALLPTVGTALIILCATPRTWVGALLCSPVLVGVGLISYSAYLWHQPLFAFARLRSIGEPEIWLFALLCVASLLLAYLSWKYVEAPFRDRKRVTTRQIFSAAGVGMAGFAAIGVVAAVQDFSWRLPPQTRALMAVTERHEEQRDDGGCNRRGDQFKAGPCVLGATDLSPQVALLGDSHATTLLQDLVAVLEPRGVSVLQLTKNSCAPAPRLKNAREVENCPLFNDWVGKVLEASDRIHTVVLSARWTFYLKQHGFDNGERGIEHRDILVVPSDTDAWQQSESRRQELVAERYRQGVDRILAMGKRVILVYPIPEAGWHVPKTLASAAYFGAELPDLSTSYERFQERNRLAYQVLDAIGDRPNLFRVKPEQVLCNTFQPERCTVQFGEVPLYYDSNHLSHAGAELVVAEIAPLLDTRPVFAQTPAEGSDAPMSGGGLL